MKRIVVPFHGAASGAEELTWGQREIWAAMVTQRSWLPIVAIRRPAPGATVADVESELRYLVSRYDSMRTRLAFEPTGQPRQVVAAEGETALEVVDAGDADPAAVAEAVADRFREGGHDFERDWPVRTAVVLHDGGPSHVVHVFCHLALDAHARAILLRDLAAARAQTGASLAQAGAGPGAMQPTELARWERGEEARQASRVSMAYWERHLRQIPARRFPASTGPRSPRHWQAMFRSRALLLALRMISPEVGTALLLAVFAVALARVTGVGTVVAQVVVSNRFRSHLAHVLAPVNQTGLWVVDVAGATFEEVFARSRRRAMGTYKHAYYDPRHRDDLIARVGAERGEDVDVACFFNDRRLDQPAPAGAAAPTAEEVRAARSDTTFAWQARTDTPNERLFVHVEDDPGVIGLTAWTDTHHLAPDDLEAVLREMEAVAVSAALDPTMPASAPTRA